MFKNATQKILAGLIGVIILLFTLSIILASALYNYISNDGNIILKTNAISTTITPIPTH
jgi:hypothetical protein